MRIYFWLTATGICATLKHGIPGLDRNKILFAHLKMLIKDIFLQKIMRRRLANERILGKTFVFPRYSTFRLLFIEIFAFGVYFYKNRNPRYIIDCGSNIGLSVFFFSTLYPTAKIIAFEPDRNAYRYLRRNVDTNRLDRVEVHNTAIYDQQGEVSFYAAVKDDDMSVVEMSIWKPSLGKRECETYIVNSVKLSTYIDRPVDLLKMDIQGVEGVVIRELDESGKLHLIKEIIMEYHPNKQNKVWPTLSLLNAHGFSWSILSAPYTPFYDYEGADHCYMVRAYRTR
jgi:FkbM family methyltransferase